MGICSRHGQGKKYILKGTNKTRLESWKCKERPKKKMLGIKKESTHREDSWNRLETRSKEGTQETEADKSLTSSRPACFT